MDQLLQSPIVWGVAAGGLVLGVVLGRLLGRAGARRDVERARELEDQLTRVEEDHARYRAQVSDHFGETSRRLRDLTLQYKSVYEHLADGARTLCPEGAVAIAPSLAEALPANAATSASPPPDDAQLDLELDALPGRWKHTDAGDDLEPLLEEEAPPAPELSRFR